MLTKRIRRSPRTAGSTHPNLECFRRRHDDLPQPRDPQGNVGPAVAREMERVQCHLRRRLAYGLGRDRPNRLARGGQAPHVLDPHEELERLLEGTRRRLVAGVVGLALFSERWRVGVEESLQRPLERLAHAPGVGDVISLESL